MKSLFKYTILTCCVLLTSCQNLLDKEPQNKISLEETFQDIESATVALSGAYASLFTVSYFNANRTLYPDVAGGNVKYAKLTNAILYDTYDFAASPDDGDMNATYAQLYAILNNLNNIITRVPSITNGTEKTRNRLVAEATALRAMIHFDLLLLFAQPYNYTSDASHVGILINLEPVLVADSQRARSTVAECYAAVIADLNNALSLFDNSTAVFSSGSTKNYMTTSAIKALLARVYLHQGNWELAYQYANEVINTGSYALYTNTAYVTAWTQKNTSESIFEIAVPNNFSGTSLGNYFDVTNVNVTANIVQMAASNDLLDLYSATDVRNQTNFYYSATVEGSTFWFCRKYPTGSTAATGVKVLRISEMYLIRAEAAAELGNLTQAETDLNTIVQRADLSAEKVTIADKDLLIERILTERRKELNYEGFLLFDLSRRKLNLVRTDCVAQTCSFNYPSNYYILPLPATTVLVNPLISQNPGY